MARTYDQAYAGLAGKYDPQAQLVQKQQADLPGEQAMAETSLQQAKVNAFKSIKDDANARGMFYSGQPVQGQNQYVSDKYMPAYMDMTSTFKQRGYQLTDAVNKINATRMDEANALVAGDQENEAKAAKDAQDDYYKRANLQISMARLGVSQGNAGLSQQKYMDQQQQDYMKQFQVFQKKDNAGYAFVGPNGKPISMAQYVGNIGGGAQDILDLLKNSAAKGDKDIYKKATTGIPVYLNDKGRTDYILKNIQKLDTKNWYGLR